MKRTGYSEDDLKKEVFCMPRMDGTGPMGMGPMTGWGQSFRGWRMGYGGCGRGMGFCRIAVDDKDALLNQKVWLEQSLKNVNDKLEKL